MRDQLLRQARGRVYDGKGGQRLTNLPQDVEPLAVIIDHLAEPAFPLTKSDAALLGVVSSLQSHFSSDETAIYSQFAVRPEEVLMNNSSDSVRVGDEILVARLGGALRVPGGKILRYRVHQEGMPIPGGRYVFFLSHNAEAEIWTVVRCYELDQGLVYTLDQAKRQKDGTLPYWGADEAAFLDDLRRAVASRKIN